MSEREREEREGADSSPLCLPKESSGKRVSGKIKIKIKIHLIVFSMVSAKKSGRHPKLIEGSQPSSQPTLPIYLYYLSYLSNQISKSLVRLFERKVE